MPWLFKIHPSTCHQANHPQGGQLLLAMQKGRNQTISGTRTKIAQVPVDVFGVKSSNDSNAFIIHIYKSFHGEVPVNAMSCFSDSKLKELLGPAQALSLRSPTRCSIYHELPGFILFSTSGEKSWQRRQVRIEPPLLTACMAPMTCEILIVDCCSCTSRNVFLHFYSSIFQPPWVSKQIERHDQPRPGLQAVSMPQEFCSMYIWLVVPTLLSNLTPAESLGEEMQQILNHQPTICPMYVQMTWQLPSYFTTKKRGFQDVSHQKTPQPLGICHNFAYGSANPHADTPANN